MNLRILNMLAFAAAVVVSGCMQSDSKPPAYEPEMGQLGKDSVWAPTPDRLIERMLQMADTRPNDVVVDLGSGDGRIPVIAAKQFGARGIGVEFDAELVAYSIRLAERMGVAKRVTFFRQDFFETDLSDASVVAMYIGPEVTMKLRPKLLALKPGTRVVTHQFTMGDWEPDEMARVENAPGYLWVVPARVEGRWRLQFADQHYAMELKQQYQMLSGSASSGGKSSPLLAARVRGESIRFSIIDVNGDSRAFTGTIGVATMQGTTRAQLRGAAPVAWSARQE
ncbi:MAG: SAM-dependent methyltransferase [Burkholderiales bacterium]